MPKPIIRLVDDDNALADSFELLLKTMGWSVAKYSSGKTFLEEDDFTAPGCIVLDVRMPDMTGLEVQTELERRGVKLPILFSFRTRQHCDGGSRGAPRSKRLS